MYLQGLLLKDVVYKQMVLLKRMSNASFILPFFNFRSNIGKCLQVESESEHTTNDVTLKLILSQVDVFFWEREQVDVDGVG